MMQNWLKQLANDTRIPDSGIYALRGGIQEREMKIHNVYEGDYIKIAGDSKFYRVDAVLGRRVECHDDGYWSSTSASFNEITDLRLRDEVPGTNFD